MPKRSQQATIPEPVEDVRSLRATAVATKELVETLAGQRGNPMDAAVTWRDLVDLGLVIPAEIPEGIGSSGFQKFRGR